MLSNRKLVIVVVILVITGYLLFKFQVPARKIIISATSATRWSEYQRLTKMLFLGMEDSKVEYILGKPDQVDEYSVGQRWFYFEDDSTTGWTYIVDFKKDNSVALKLCYVANIEHRMFPSSKRSEIGQPLKFNEPERTILFGIPNTTSNKASDPSIQK